MLIQGDAAAIPLPDKSVHCAVTSPPYWGLRKYSGDQGRIWGGDPECEHEWPKIELEKIGHRGERNELPDPPAAWSTREHDLKSIGGGAICQLCGAWYGSLGLEPTPEQHIENIVEICREVRRVLRDDGVFWLNYGDCYTGSGGAHAPTHSNPGISNSAVRSGVAAHNLKHGIRTHSRLPIRAGNLLLMPHRVTLALQADGWIVRQDLVWFKRNPMPESIAGTRWVQHRIKEGRSKHAADHNIKGGTQKMLEDASVHQGIDEDWVPEYIDCPGCEKCIPNDGLVLKRGSFRHTRAHEYVFMLVKGMQYWSNQEAVREASKQLDPNDPGYRPAKVKGYTSGGDRRYGDNDAGKKFGKDFEFRLDPAGRNPRSVLDVPTAPYSGAHYATFPPNLIAPLIRATCPRRACPVCGQGWAAVVDIERKHISDVPIRPADESDHHGMAGNPRWKTDTSVLGYRPTCEHEHTQEEAVPGIVFDPFVGSGTTVKVAQDLLRRGIGLDISMPYLDEQAKVRTGLGTPSKALEELPLFQ